MTNIIQDFESQFCKSSVPVLKTGYLVKVSQKVKEGNKERVQLFQGTIIKINAGHGLNQTFTVRKISGGIGVEKVFSLHHPSIESVEVIRAQKVRRSKLFYLRERSGKALRMKEIPLDLQFQSFGSKESEVKEEATA